MSFSLGGDLLASGSDDQTIRLWDVMTQRERAVLSEHSDTVHSVSFSPGGELLASSSKDRTLQLWDVAAQRERPVNLRPWFGAGFLICLYGAAQRMRAKLLGDPYRFTAVSFSRVGDLLASGSEDARVWLWDVAAYRKCAVLYGHTRIVWSVSFSPRSDFLASGSADTTVRLWDVAAQREHAVLAGHTGLVWSVTFSPKGDLLASGSADQTIRLWDVATQRERAVLTGHTDKVRSVSFSPRGGLLASGSEDQTVRLWDVASGRQLDWLPMNDAVLALWFSPDGRQLRVADAGASTGRPTIRILDIMMPEEALGNSRGARILQPRPRTKKRKDRP